MGCDLIMLGLDEVVDHMGGESVFAPIVAEPLSTAFVAALDHAVDIGDATVGAGVGRPLLSHRVCG